MGVESKIRELMEGAANRPLDKSQGDTTNPTQGSSNPNPEKQDLSGSDDKGGLTSPVGKAAASKSSKDNTLPKGQGAGKAPNFDDEEDPKSVVNQATSAGVREEAETEDEEVIVEDEATEVDEVISEEEEEEVAVEEDEALFEADLQQLFADDENLTEEFKLKAAEIFEAVVTSRVANEVEAIEAELTEQANAAFEAQVEELVENVDKYMSYCVENWMKENELAIERGLRNEVTESFIKGLQQVFTEHYIEIPEEKYDVLGEMQTKIDELQSKLDEQVQKNVDLTEESVALKKQNIFAEIAEGLATTEAEKFATLVEDITYSGEDSYKNKLKVVKENYFRKDTMSTVSDKLEDTVTEINTSVNSVMSKYAAAIAKTAKF